MQMRFSSNRKLLIGFGIQITSVSLYFAVILSYDSLPNLVKAMFTLFYAAAATLQIMGMMEDAKLRKREKIQPSPEPH